MQSYTEIIAPSAVTHAASLPFLQPDVNDLVVAKTSLLQIFRLSQRAGDTDDARRKLSLVADYALPGTITSIAGIKASNTKTGGDALLISFRDAKVSLLEWNPETHGLSTISVHYYETDDLLGSSWAPHVKDCSSYLRVDPTSRCAALKFGVRHLAMIPFRQAGDDLTLGDYDPDLDRVPPPKHTSDAVNANQGTPYDASFVLLLTELDPRVIHVEDLAFLYEYREPTLGVLSSSGCPSSAVAQDRKDCLTYTAFTLDLQQRASTALISVSSLPSDLFKVVPLPLPVGGAFLIGSNELVHVDQAGKTHAVAVNTFAKRASAFPMTDQGNLGLRLEGSHVAQINTSGEVLLVINDGTFISLKFRMDGRSVSGLTLRRIPHEHGGFLLGAPASCASGLDNESVFVGSEEADSLLIHTAHARATLSRKRSHADMLGVSEDAASDEDVDDEDDLYSDAVPLARVQSQNAGQTLSNESRYSAMDRLPNLTPSGEPVFAKRRKVGVSTSGSSDKIEMAMASGSGTASKVAFMSKSVMLEQEREVSLPDAELVWSLNVTRGKDAYSSEEDSSQTRDELLITSAPSTQAEAKSNIYDIKSNGVVEHLASEFETGVATLDAGTVYQGKRIVQISAGEVRCYPPDLSFPQIFPMTDDSGDAELKVEHSSILDPYVLLLRDDRSCTLLKADKKGELDEVEHGELLAQHKWASGCLCLPDGDDSAPLAILLSTDGALHIFRLPNLDAPAFSFENLGLLPPNIGPDFTYRRSANREKLVEVVAADLGYDDVSAFHLILRTGDNGLAIYKPYHYPSKATSSFTANLRWTKICELPANEDSNAADDDEYGIDGERVIPSRKPMKVLQGLDGYRAVFVPGAQPSLIMKESTSLPRLVKIRDVTDISIVPEVQLPTDERQASRSRRGAIMIGPQGAYIAHLPSGARYDTGWAVQTVPQHQHVETVCHHASSGHFMVCINEPSDFKLPEDDDWHPEWSKEETSFKPQSATGKVRLIDGTTKLTLHEMSMEPDEVILCAKVLDLEVSEITRQRAQRIVVGTAVMKGEDQPSNGVIYVYDVIQVVPHPERPESVHALTLISREEVKGAVTCLSDIGEDGLVLAAQGQKLMVRGLKEDGTMLPVSFMDVQVQVTALKNVKGTGMALIGDALKGIWLLGFATDPYRMQLFGKSRSAMQVVVAELLPYQQQLFAFVLDTDCILHVLEYNPEDPKSLSGQRLLNRSSFHTGHFPTAMTLLPTSSSSQAPAEVNGEAEVNGNTHPNPQSPQTVLVTAQSGSMALIAPLDEQTYRRLGALQNYLNGILDHPCGLNPRAYRSVDNEAFGGRGVLDGQVLLRWNMLSSQRKAEACARVGADVWQMKADLAGIAGGDLEYL